MTSGTRPDADGQDTVTVTVLGTSDVHSRIFDFDYVTDSAEVGQSVGFARLGTLIRRIRSQRPDGSVLTLDCGDTIEGTPLGYYFARKEPITDGVTAHPVAAAMNAISFDAAAIGNHEFNYGLDVLDRFAAQVDHPLLAANVLDAATGEARYDSWALRAVPTPLGTVTVGIVGLVTPGCAVWDRAHLDGRVAVDGVVERARVVVPQVRAAGADVVVVCCHSGADLSSSYGSALPWPENASGLLAEQVAGIDAILVGHAHDEIPQRLVECVEDGRTVLLSEPGRWGNWLSVMDLGLTRVDGAWQVVSAVSTLLDPSECPPDPAVVEATSAAHEAVRRYVNSPIGSASAEMSAAMSRVQDSPVLQFVNHVQAAAVAGLLAGTAWDGLPVLSAAAAFNSRAVVPAGRISVRDIAGLYNYDNVLSAVPVTGADLRAYLEYAARYYRPASGPGPLAVADVTNAPTSTAPTGVPDYNLDIVAGLDAALTYDIDLARPVGSRIVGLAYAGSPVTAADRFVLAGNNYRQSGGGGYPAVAPSLIDAQVEVREAILDWVRDAGVIDAARFGGVHWRLVADGTPIEFVD